MQLRALLRSTGVCAQARECCSTVATFSAENPVLSHIQSLCVHVVMSRRIRPVIQWLVPVRNRKSWR